MYRLFLSLIAVITVISTLCILIFKPEMHKSVMIYDSAFEIVQPVENSVEIKNIPTQQKTVSEKTTVKTTTPQKVVTRVIEIPQKQQITKTQNKNVVKETKSQVVQKQTSSQKTKNSPVKTTSSPVKTAKQLTQQQEVILWNKWRSDLQNQIMRDVRLPIVQAGTVFKFSFEVDKYGKVSNLQTWSTNPVYTPYAIQYIAPVIKSYQGRSILNFPEGSNRVVTLVEGGWKIADATKYSTPADFKDVEKLRK